MHCYSKNNNLKYFRFCYMKLLIKYMIRGTPTNPFNIETKSEILYMI